MVGLHVIDDQVVDGAVANDLLDFIEEEVEIVHIDRVDEGYFLVSNQIGVVSHSIRQWPQAFE